MRSSTKRTMDVFYGLAVVNPTYAAKIVMPPLTWREALRAMAREVWFVTTQAALFAGSVTAFAVAFGVIR